VAKEPVPELEHRVGEIVAERFRRIGVEIDRFESYEATRDALKHAAEDLKSQSGRRDKVRAGLAGLWWGLAGIIVAWLLNPAGGKLWQILPLLAK
jgi:Flp pilus assembly protein TadB